MALLTSAYAAPTAVWLAASGRILRRASHGQGSDGRASHGRGHRTGWPSHRRASSVAEEGGQRMITSVHSIIYASDADAARAFLRDVIGLPHVDAHDGWLIFKLPPSELAVHPEDEP